MIAKLDAWAEPQKNITMERAKFNSRIQSSTEKFDSFMSDLKRLISTCEYGDLRDEILKDRIVMEVADVKLKEQLLRISDLTLEKAAFSSKRKYGCVMNPQHSRGGRCEKSRRTWKWEFIQSTAWSIQPTKSPIPATRIAITIKM